MKNIKWKFIFKTLLVATLSALGLTVIVTIPGEILLCFSGLGVITLAVAYFSIWTVKNFLS